MTDRAILRIRVVLVLALLAIAGRQLYVQLIAAPTISAVPTNPRRHLAAAGRGRILASDGPPLERTVSGVRVYSMHGAAAQLIGYDSVRYGTSGIEDAYNAALEPATRSGDPFAQWQALVDAFQGKPASVHGADVITTISPTITRVLAEQLSRYPRGAGVVLDARTGAVLAMVSQPTFDPNTIDTTFAKTVLLKQSPLLNRAIDGEYPPGSTFKILTASAAIDSGTFTPQSHFYDPGYLHIGSFTLHDNEGEATGSQTLTGAFALSSNVDFARVGMKLGVDTFYEYLHRFDVGASLDFQLPATVSHIPDPKDLSDGELAQLAFGQGALTVSPLQMALIAAAVANGGKEPRPYVVRDVLRDGVHVGTVTPSTLAIPITADTAAAVTKMMVAVVKFGTGTTAALPGVTVAGKTGTATNPLGRPHSWFVCFAPADAPRVVVAVVVENAGYGATVAAPIARAVLASALKVVR